MLASSKAMYKISNLLTLEAEVGVIGGPAASVVFRGGMGDLFRLCASGEFCGLMPVPGLCRGLVPADSGRPTKHGTEKNVFSNANISLAGTKNCQELKE